MRDADSQVQTTRSGGAQLVSYVDNYFYLGLQLRLRIIGLGAASPRLPYNIHKQIHRSAVSGRACPRPDARNFKVALWSQIILWGNKKNIEDETIEVSWMWHTSWWLIRWFPFDLIEDHTIG